MERKSIKKNYIFNVAYQVLTLITPLVTAPYLSRVLGAEGIGRVSFAESVASYFSLVAAMGIGTYGQREVSYVQDDIVRRSIVFWNAKILSFCTSGAMILAYVAFALAQGNDSTIYLILTLNLVSNFFDITWFFQGMEDFEKTVTRNAVVKIVNIAYIFVFVNGREDLPIYVLGSALFSVLGNLSLWLYLPKYLVRVPMSEIHPFRDVKTVLTLFIPTIAIQIYTVLDKTMIGIITRDAYENGCYEQAMKISKMLLSLVTSLGTVMVPRIGFLYEKGDHEQIQKYMYRSYRFVWFLGIPICLGTVIVASNFVPWFFGSGYEKVISNLQILSWLILAIGINNVTGIQYLIPTKRQNTFTLTVTVGAVINFSLNLVLINVLKSVGAAIASVMAETTIAIVQLIIVRNEISPMRVIGECRHYLAAGAVMALALVPMARSFSPSVIHTLEMVALGALAYFITLLIERDDFLLSNLKMVWRKVAKGRG